MKKNILVLLILGLLVFAGCAKKEEQKSNGQSEEPKEVIEEKVEKVNIIDLESNSRPYAVVINNYPDATKVQTGLNEAYIIYELPIEGGMTRSVALYKDKTDVKIGTVRSARHDYLDYVLENDAIFVHFGWSKKAMQQIPQLGIDNIDGNSADPSAFWRENPKGLATEHTVYTNLSTIIDYNKNTKKYRTTTDVKPSLNYVTEEVNLSEHDDSKKTNSVELVYSGSYTVKFNYNEKTKKYDRFINGSSHKDYFTKEQFDSKNIIVILLDWGVVAEYADAAGNNYLDLYNTGTGQGYYITNGYSKKITWEKKNRDSETIYKYADGTIVDINDGNTYIMFHSNGQTLSIS